MTDASVLRPDDIEIAVDPGLSPTLQRQLTELWVTVTNDGGAVGFLPPVTDAEIRPEADQVFRRISAGSDHLIVARSGTDLAGWVMLETQSRPLVRHWAWLKRLMVLPSARGVGLGGRLTAAAVALGRKLGLEQLYLTCRSETGLAEFYARSGWVEVGRMPRNLRVADGTYRDEIYMMLVL